MRSALRCSIGLALLTWLALAGGCGDARRARPADDSAAAIRGGTLKIVTGGDFDHLATTSAYTTGSIAFLRTFTRQLISYPSSQDFEEASKLAPDLASTLPTYQNGGISADGRTYTFHLRHGMLWNTKPPREVTAHDAVRGIKLLCNPVNPAGALGYYESTILGMREYCRAFARVPGTVADIKRFIEAQDLEGVRAIDDLTVVFRLSNPASDFLNILALPFASPVPMEYLDYLPDSPEFRQHTISNGPYQITKYTPNREIQLERNPVWEASLDPLRPAYVDHIRVVFGIDPQLVQLQLEAGTADLTFDVPPVAALSALLEIGDPNLMLSPPGQYYGLFSYLSINHVGPNNGGALKKLKVRQALQCAIDKAALVQNRGGPRVARPLRQAVMTSVTGYRPGADRYQTPGDRGDPVMARKLLAEAGYPNGLSLKLVYIVYSSYLLDAQSLQASLQRAGIRVQLIASTWADYFGRLLPNPENARRGSWDIAIVGWVPDWFGVNNGRAVLAQLFDGRRFGLNTVNYGGYNSREVNVLIDRAVIAPSVEEAEQAWAEAVRHVMDDAALIPLVEEKQAYYRSARTRGCATTIFNLNCDLTAIWLEDASPVRGEKR